MTRVPETTEWETGTRSKMYSYFMLLTRGVEARIRKLYLQGKVVGGVYGGYGQEAVGGFRVCAKPGDG